MVDEKIDFGLVSYILGIVSIVLSLVTPLSGIILSIVGIVISKKEKNLASKRGKKLCTIALIIGIIVFVVGVAFMIYQLNQSGALNVLE